MYVYVCVFAYVCELLFRIISVLTPSEIQTKHLHETHYLKSKHSGQANGQPEISMTLLHYVMIRNSLNGSELLVNTDNINKLAI